MKRVLIVDDEGLILDGLSKYLSNIDVNEITTAKNGTDALKKISTCFYNLCFLDIYLPDINGLDVMKKIKEISPHTKVVIMTSQDITDTMKNEIENHAFHFIGKPFDLSQVKTISELALGDFKRIKKGDRPYKDGRHYKRMPYAHSVNYSAGVYESGELKILNLTASVIDISDGGIGITTDYELKPGFMIRFDDEARQNVGIVKWSISSGPSLYRAGIEFLKSA